MSAAAALVASVGCKAEDKGTKQGGEMVAKAKRVVDELCAAKCPDVACVKKHIAAIKALSAELKKTTASKAQDEAAKAQADRARVCMKKALTALNKGAPAAPAAPAGGAARAGAVRDCGALAKKLLDGSDEQVQKAPPATRAKLAARFKRQRRFIIDRCTFALSVGVRKLERAFDCLVNAKSAVAIKRCLAAHGAHALFYMHHAKDLPLQPKAGPACVRAVDHVFALLLKSGADIDDLDGYKRYKRESDAYVSALGRCRTYPAKNRACVLAATTVEALRACEKDAPFPSRLVR